MNQRCPRGGLISPTCQEVVTPARRPGVLDCFWSWPQVTEGAFYELQLLLRLFKGG